MRQDIDAFFNSTPLNDCQDNNNTVTFKRFFKWTGKEEIVKDLEKKNVDIKIPPS